jgi:hypothetical protein
VRGQLVPFIFYPEEKYLSRVALQSGFVMLLRFVYELGFANETRIRVHSGVATLPGVAAQSRIANETGIVVLSRIAHQPRLVPLLGIAYQTWIAHQSRFAPHFLHKSL